MIALEWMEVIKGNDKFVDNVAELLCNEILERVSLEKDSMKILEYVRDLEIVMSWIEWVSRKIKRMKESILFEKDENEVVLMREKIQRLIEIRNSYVKQLAEKYGVDIDDAVFYRP